MIELISARDTLDFLAKSAPRPWVKRMILWMIFNGEVAAFFRQGTSIAKARVFTILLNELKGDYDRVDLIRERFDAEMAERLISAGESGEIEDVVLEWHQDEEPRKVSAGFFVYASSIEWDRGELRAEVLWEQSEVRSFFNDEDDVFGSEFPHAEYAIKMSGLCFAREVIEMLQPHVELGPAIGRNSQGTARVGRPRTWDWEGATSQLLMIAQTPDGLPIGQGAQAQIERLIADWFMTSTGNSPAVSQVRQHATKIMAALKKPKSL